MIWSSSAKREIPHTQKKHISLLFSLSTVPPIYTGKAAEATGAAASSGEDEEEDFLAVIAPEIPREDEQPEGFVDKLKRWCSWLYYYIAISVDKVIDLLNDISKDYREIADQLKKERKEKRIEKLRRARFGYVGARPRLGDASDPEADTKVRVHCTYTFIIFPSRMCSEFTFAKRLL